MKDPLWDPITQQKQTQAFIDGRNARFAGHDREEANPHPLGSDADLDFFNGWTKADELKKYIAEMFEKMANSIPPPQDRFVVELEALLTKYNYRITGVDTVHDYLYFEEGSHKRYDFAADGGNGRFMAARPIGG